MSRLIETRIIEQRVLKSLPVINSLLSFLIVFHHGFTRNVEFRNSFSLSTYGVVTVVERFMYNLSECAVPLFFLLSSYLFYRTFDGTKECYIYKMQRRLHSLLIPYLIFNTIGYVKTIVFSGRCGGAIDCLLSIWNSDTMPLWFIRELMFFSLLSPIIYRIKNRIGLSIVVSFIMIVLSILGIVGYRCFLYWMPIYLLGASINRKRITNVYAFLENHKYCLSLITLYCLWAWFLPNGVEKYKLVYRLEFYLFRLMAPWVFCGIIFIIIKRQVTVRKWMLYSFFVYCIHAPIISIVKLLLGRILHLYGNVELLSYLCEILLTYALCVLLAIVLERYFYPLWKILNGNR